MSAWVEMRENIRKIEASDTVTDYVNLHPSFAFRPAEYRSPIAFTSMQLWGLVGKHMRVPATQKTRDFSTDFDVPNTQQVWSVVRSVLALATKGDPANILAQQLARYETLRRQNSPQFKSPTVFSCIASFFDDIFYPAIGSLRSPLKAFVRSQASAHASEFIRFETFYRNELEQPSIERYLSTFTDYFRFFDQLRQVLVHARVGDEDVDDLVVGSKRFDDIKLYYGQAYETLTSNYVFLACVYNLSKGRPFDRFESMSLAKYVKDVEKAKRSNPFRDVPELASFIRFEDSALRNGSHHASIWRQGEVIKFRSGGSGAERDMSYSRYMHACNSITIALAAMFLVELQTVSSLRPI